ncbi:MAG: PAAR-like protein [Cetobacterium sp.]
MSKVVVIGSNYICDQGGILNIAQGNSVLKSDGKPVVDSNCKTFIFVPAIPCRILTKNPSTPIPCNPVITKWEGAENSVKIQGKNIITENCKANCSIGGKISFSKGNNFKNVSIK